MTADLPPALRDDPVLRLEYETALEQWRSMVARYGPGLTWRDEQSFLRGWCAGKGLT